ncbi:MAG TPA: hypothetical protein VF896_11395 [Anaerolineales bacterium]
MLENHLVYFAEPNINSSQSDEETEEVCIANISPLERQKRLRFGVTQFIIGLIILSALIAFGVDRLWRLPLLFMFWTSAIGYFQARDKTRVSLASRGSRKLGDNIEKIEDHAELAQVRRQARRVIFRAFLVALLLTGIACIIPL